MRWITFGCILFDWLLLSTNALVTIELWMKQFNLPDTEKVTGSHSVPRNYSFTVTLEVGNKIRQTWNFQVKLDGEISGGVRSLLLPEFLSPALHNPLMYSIPFEEREKEKEEEQDPSVRLSVIVHNPRSNATLVPIAKFHTSWNVYTALIEQSAYNAPLRPVSMVDAGARFTLFVRWYCGHGFAGKRCKIACDAHLCNTDDRTNASNQMIATKDLYWNSRTLVRVPPLGDADCPCDPCLIVDVPDAFFLNRTMLQIYLDFFMLLRADPSDVQSNDLYHPYLPANVHTKLHIEKVWQSYNHPVVAICVSAVWNGQQLASSIIRKVLVDLLTTGWIYTALTGGSRPRSFDRFSAVDPVKQVNAFRELYREIASKCNAKHSSQAVLLGGFWLVLCMAVIMSCVVAYLLNGQENAEKDLTVSLIDENSHEQSIETIS